MKNITCKKLRSIKSVFVIILFFMISVLQANEPVTENCEKTAVGTIKLEEEKKKELKAQNNDSDDSEISSYTAILSKPDDIVTNITMCQGDSFAWLQNYVVYTTAQTGVRVVKDSLTADQVLNIFITPKPADITSNISLRRGESYFWPENGLTYHFSNVVRTATARRDGCTANQVLIISPASKPADIVTNRTICQGESYRWAANGVTYTSTQTGLRIVNDIYTADQVLNLTVTPKPEITTYKSICPGETYTWPASGRVFSYSDTGRTYGMLGFGCNPTLYLNLSAGTKEATITTTETICEGERYTWAANGVEYTTNQNGISFINNNCSADQILYLTVIPKPLPNITNAIICEGEKYLWAANNVEYTTPQSALTLVGAGCTANEVLNLTVTPKPVEIVTNETICEGQRYIWPVNGIEYTTTQNNLTLTYDGCTANQVLNLTVTPKQIDNVTNVTICSGERYVWPANGQVYTTTQTGLRLSNSGCAADEVLNLTVRVKLPPVITTIAICAGEIYNWAEDGDDYDFSYVGRTIVLVKSGCEADQVLVVTAGTKQADNVTAATICEGESYTWAVNGVAYTTTQTGLTITSASCAANQVLNLTVTPKPLQIVTNITICSGESYRWAANDVEYTTTQTGLTITNDGCTANEVLNLTVTPKPIDIVTNATICEGERYTWAVNGTEYSTAQSGLTITNDGCTANQVLNLIITGKPADIVTDATICNGESYRWAANGMEYTTDQNGLTITNDRCTANQVLNLTVTYKLPDVITNAIICTGESYTWAADGKSYTTPQSGLTITNPGCAANQVLNLTITAKQPEVITNVTICAGERYVWAANGAEYTTSQNGLTLIYNDCAANQILNLTVLAELKASVVANSLFPESCAGERNGAFSIEITGGKAPYAYSLNRSAGPFTAGSADQVIFDFTNLSSGTYTVYIKDEQGCLSEIEVILPDGVVLNPIATINDNCSDNLPINSVTVTIDPSNTNPADLDYTLDGNPSGYQSSNIFTNIAPGNHTITVRHTSGCMQSTRAFNITEIKPLKLSVENGELNEIIATAADGTGNYEYSFDEESFNTKNKFIIYKSGLHTVTVRDRSGCTVTVSKHFEYIDVCIPTHFTPNGDGINDHWGPDCTVNYRNLTYAIIDRYGRTIAQYKLGQKWDGKYNGKELATGDYWYVLKLNDPKDNREFVGHFNLYR